MEHYAEVKERLVARAETAVIAVEDEYTRAIAERLEQRGHNVIRVSSQAFVSPGIFLDGTTIVRATERDAEPIADLDGIGSLRGRHNAQNAAAVIAAALTLGLTPEQIRVGLATFPGLAHRLEELGRKGKVLFVNDSKATNADSTEKALSSFEGGIYWIVGGKPKEGGIKPLKPYFPRIAHAYLIGESSDAFAATLEGEVPYTRCGTLDVATEKAASDAEKSEQNQPVVLLSPACASFDQFRNFEIRGERFRERVRAIAGFQDLVSKGLASKE
jgi:UDP-N-acetylmuramoylalanine--D-glutamate ligase